MTVSLTSNLRNFMVVQNSMAGGKMGETGDTSFLLSRGFILAVVFSGSVFDLLRGQVSSNKCDYSSRTLRNVEGRLTRVVIASCLQIQASSMLTVFCSVVDDFMVCSAFVVAVG